MRLRYWCSSWAGFGGVGVGSGFEVPFVVGESLVLEDGSVEDMTGCRFVAILCAVQISESGG